VFLHICLVLLEIKILLFVLAYVTSRARHQRTPKHVRGLILQRLLVKTDGDSNSDTATTTTLALLSPSTFVLTAMALTVTTAAADSMTSLAAETNTTTTPTMTRFVAATVTTRHAIRQPATKLAT